MAFEEMAGSYGAVIVELGKGVAGYTGESDAARVAKKREYVTIMSSVGLCLSEFAS